MYGVPGSVVVVDLTPEALDLDGWADHAPDDEEIRYAQRAVCVHAPERWQHGMFCLNCRAPYPCRLHRWGWRVLRTAGWTEAAVAEMFATYRRTSLPPWLLPAD